MRIQIDELKVRAWQESLDSDMGLDIAKRAVYTHYSNSEVAITVAHINRFWRKHRDHLQQIENQRLFRLEIEENESNKASQEVVDKYMAEIRQALSRGKNASMENLDGTVAPN